MRAVMEVDYDNMKSASCLIFGGGISGFHSAMSSGTSEVTKIKSEPVFLGEGVVDGRRSIVQ